MSGKTYKAAYGKGSDVTLTLPDTWAVETVRMERPVMARARIQEVIRCPAGSKSLCDLARAAKTVGIILEDHTRFTPLADAMDIVLEELFRGGIQPGCVKLIGASATHRVTTGADIAKKISADAMKKVRVIEHGVLDQARLTHVGTTTRGTKVCVNAEIAACDLIVGMGGIAPHGSVQFGGGAKLLLPGISGYDTIRHNHTRIEQDITYTGDAVRPMRQDMEEALGMVHYAFNVSGLIDHNGTLVDMVAGDPIAAHRKGVEIAKALYYFPVGEKADVVVACSNPLDVDCFQSIKGLLPAVEFVKPKGAVLWLSACTEGIGTHELTQSDEAYCQAMLRGMRARCDVANVLLYARKMDRSELYRYIPAQISYYTDLDEAVCRLVELAPKHARAKILWAAPFTVGV